MVLDGDTGMWLANKMRWDVATATVVGCGDGYGGAYWVVAEMGSEGSGQGSGLGVPSAPLAGSPGVAKEGQGRMRARCSTRRKLDS
jgi:hypothetical protein